MITGSEKESQKLMMNAAIEIVAEHGLEGFTTKKWAHSAGVAEGSLYYHFKSKNDLLDQTFLYIDAEIWSFMNCDPVEIMSGDYMEGIRTLWSRFYQYLIGNPKKTLYYFRYRTSTHYTDEIHSQQVPAYKAFFEMMDQLNEKTGYRSKVRSKILWTFVVDCTLSFAFRVINGRLENDKATEEQMLNLFLDGVGSIF